MSLIMLMIVLLATVGLAIATKQVCISGRICTLNCKMEGTGPIELAKWTREDLNPNVVYLYRDGNPSLGQNPQFKNRTRLSPEGLKSGDASLTFTNVNKSDEGTYKYTVKLEQSPPSRGKRAADARLSSTIKLEVKDPDQRTNTQNEEEPHNTHSDPVLRGRTPLILSVGLMAAVCVVGLWEFKRRGFPKSQNQPAKVPTQEQV